MSGWGDGAAGLKVLKVGVSHNAPDVRVRGKAHIAMTSRNFRFLLRTELERPMPKIGGMHSSYGLKLFEAKNRPKIAAFRSWIVSSSR
jgi:hypothetical protein